MTSSDDIQSNALIGISADHWTRGYSYSAIKSALIRSSEIGFNSLTIPIKLQPTGGPSPSRFRNWQDISVEDAKKIRQLAEDKHMTLFVQCELYGYADEDSIFHNESEVVERALDALLKGLETTDQLGSNYMGGVLYSDAWALEKRFDYEDSDYEEKRAAHSRAMSDAHDNLKDALSKLAKATHEKGISVGVQESQPSYWIRSIVLDMDDSPNLKVHFVANQQLDDYGKGWVTRSLSACGQKLGYVVFRHKSFSPRHCKDTEAADVNFFAALKAMEYAGPVTAVPPVSIPVLEMVTPAARFLMENFEGNGEDAAMACLAFLSDHMNQANN